jgi:hypothetical protein
VSAAQVVSSLGDYSTLSQQYDQRRAAYWTQAVAVLTNTQRQRFNRPIETERREE